MRSFYASCASAFEGLDVMKVPIAIIGNKERKGGIVLAASPPLKKQFGVRTGMRYFKYPMFRMDHLLTRFKKFSEYDCRHRDNRP